MIKKICIDVDDRKKMFDWNLTKFRNVTDKIGSLALDEENEYVIGMDIAAEDSSDHSVMMRFIVVNGEYVYDGVEEI